MNNEADMLRRYVEENSEAAFAQFVQHTIDFVYSAALRRLDGNGHAAADVAQHVFIAAARNARTLARHPSVTGWLYSTTRNLALNLMRDQILRRQREHEAQLERDLRASDAPSPDWERLRPVLDAAIDELHERDREAVLLRFFQARSFEEIGARMQLSESGARMRVERAVDKLHALLAKRGIRSTTAALGVALANEVTIAAPAALAGGVTRAALASVGATAGSTLTFIQLMTTTKFLGGAAAALALLAIGFAGRTLRARDEAHTALAAAKLRHAEMTARAGELERRVSAAQETMAELQQKVSTAEAKVILDTEAAKSASGWDPVAEGKAFQQRHPEITAHMNEWKDVWLTGRYGDFWKSRGLTQPQIEEFKSLFGWSQARKITSDGKFAQFSVEGRTATGAEFQQQMKALLGEDGWQEFKELTLTTNGANRYVYELARGLSFSESPLTPAQANRLSQTITDEIRRQRPPPFSWDPVDVMANQTLSSEQLRVWKNVSALGRAEVQRNVAAQAAQKASSPSSPK